MLFPTTLVLTLAAGFVSAVAVPAPQTTTPPPEINYFSLNVWRHYRSPPPLINGPLQINQDGHAVFNQSAPAGFRDFSLQNGANPREGSLIDKATGHSGYLMPYNPGSPDTTYLLRFGTAIPKVAGVLYSNFTAQPRICGGNCGGIDLRYGGEWGTFFIVPHPRGGAPGGAYKDTWLVKFSKAAAPRPEGALDVILFM